MKSINKALKKMYPDKDIEVVSGDGYVYFDGDDGFDKIETIWIHPKSVGMKVLKEIVLNHVKSSCN